MREEERGTRNEGRGTRTDEGRGTSERVGKMTRGGEAGGRRARADGSTGGATARGRGERVRCGVARGDRFCAGRRAGRGRRAPLVLPHRSSARARSTCCAKATRGKIARNATTASAARARRQEARMSRRRCGAGRLNGRGTGTRSSGRARRVEREPTPPRGWRVQGARARKDVKSERAGATFTRLEEAVARARVLARSGHHPPIKLRVGWRVLPRGGWSVTDRLQVCSLDASSDLGL